MTIFRFKSEFNKERQMSIWDTIEELPVPPQKPDSVVDNAFSGLSKFTRFKVKMIQQKVNFFPEEVSYANPYVDNYFDSEPREEPHPEYGYDPYKQSGELRFRVVLLPASRDDYEYELFKYKYSIEFYPVQVFIDVRLFDHINMPHAIGKNSISISNEEHFAEFLESLIRSTKTLDLISRLSAIGTTY